MKAATILMQLQDGVNYLETTVTIGKTITVSAETSGSDAGKQDDGTCAATVTGITYVSGYVPAKDNVLWVWGCEVTDSTGTYWTLTGVYNTSSVGIYVEVTSTTLSTADDPFTIGGSTDCALTTDYTNAEATGEVNWIGYTLPADTEFEVESNADDQQTTEVGSKSLYTDSFSTDGTATIALNDPSSGYGKKVWL